MQPVRISGLVLRETPFGESDKMMTVLTAERGRISVFGRGARRLKSDFFVATQLFCYTEFVLVQSSEKYYIRECSLIESFYNVRATLQGLALASYIADVAADAATEEHEHAELLRLTLNCFWAICDGKKPLKQAEKAARPAAEPSVRKKRCGRCWKPSCSCPYRRAPGRKS